MRNPLAPSFVVRSNLNQKHAQNRTSTEMSKEGGQEGGGEGATTTFENQQDDRAFPAVWNHSKEDYRGKNRRGRKKSTFGPDKCNKFRNGVPLKKRKGGGSNQVLKGKLTWGWGGG